MPKHEPIVDQLGSALIDAIDAFGREHRDMTTGQVMGALFGVFLTVAEESPAYDPEKFMKEVSARMRAATEHKGTMQ